MPSAAKTITPETKGKTGSRHQPERTRAAILEAAMREFALEGVAGARTDEIARSAGVNKALLYYYFKDKEGLFGACLDELFSNLGTAIDVAIARGSTPTEKFLGYLCAHFDWVASSPLRPRLFQREMMRSGRNGSPHLKHIVERYMRPTFGKVAGLIREGIEAGEFRAVDPAQFIPSVIGVVVFYFATPVPMLMTGVDPYAPENVAQRRAAVIDFISAALLREYSGSGAPSHPPLSGERCGTHAVLPSPSRNRGKGARQ
jgi:TetR/AcrR family transcriptional regulator